MNDGALDTPAIARGTILVYRIYDAGDTVDLEAAQRLTGTQRVDFGGPLVGGLVIPVRPLEMPLGACELTLRGESAPLSARATAHVFDFGAISIVYEVPIASGSSLASLIPRCDALYDSADVSERGRAHRDEVVARLRPSIEGTHDWVEAETYTVVFVEELARGSIDDLTRSEVVAKLLLGETSTRPLSAAVREDVLKHAFSYLSDDLAIVDWNSALVVEPTGSRVVAHVLELATCQLLEFRYYDGLIDRELARVYDYVERARPSVVRSPYGALTRQVMRRFMELTEFTERVDNAIKSVGDFYLARVYLAAIRRFRVPEWRESVEAKLGLVARAYELLKGEVEVSRAQILELIVVILILVEVVAAFRGH